MTESENHVPSDLALKSGRRDQRQRKSAGMTDLRRAPQFERLSAQRNRISMTLIER
jgi:hypothetical protein